MNFESLIARLWSATSNWIELNWSLVYLSSSKIIIPLYSNFQKNLSFFRLFNRHIGFAILNVETLISKSWSETSKISVYRFWIQFKFFSYFSLSPYCIRYFKYRKSNSKILMSDLKGRRYQFFAKKSIFLSF